MSHSCLRLRRQLSGLKQSQQDSPVDFLSSKDIASLIVVAAPPVRPRRGYMTAIPEFVKAARCAEVEPLAKRRSSAFYDRRLLIPCA